jgi:hypothetical protein
MSQGLAFLIWLLCVGISAVLISYFLKNSLKPVIREGFAVYTCPSGTNDFVTDSGETHCCNGDVVDNYCTGNLRCTLSPKSKSGLPTCTDLAASDAAAAGADRCPTSMPHYFGCSTAIEGCSASTPSANGLQPSDPLQPQCILYKTRPEELVKLDSCYNVRQAIVKETECSAAKATSNLPACIAAANAANTPPSAGSSSCPVPEYKRKVILGSNSSGVKTIDLPSGAPASGLCVALLSNQYSDTFKFTIANNRLTATRTDAPNQGWGAQHEVVVFTCGS